MNKWQRTRAGRAAGVTAVLALVLTGCGGGDEPGTDPDASSDSPSPTSSSSSGSAASPSGTTTGTTEPAVPRATGAPLAFDPAATTLTDAEVRDIALTSESALTLTSRMLTVRSAPELDAAYEIPAEAGALTDLWVDRAGEVGLLVEAFALPGEGTSTGVDVYTVRRFDVGSGEITGTAKLESRQNPRTSSGTPAARVSGTAGDVVVLDTWPSTGSPDDVFAIESAPHTTLVGDLASGGLAWTAPGTRPLEVVDDLVVVTTGTPSKNGKVRGLALGSGQERWSTLSGTRSANVVGAQDDRLTLAVARGSSKATVTTIDTSTGEPGTSRATTTWNWGCHETSTAIAVCSLLGTNRVVGWNLARNAPAWSLPTKDRFAPAISTVYEDAVYGLVAGGRGVVLDALTGADLASDTGGAPAVVSPAGGLSMLGGEAVFQPAL